LGNKKFGRFLILISKPGLWVNLAILTPVNNGIISRGVK
jgi:hypothetical protein